MRVLLSLSESTPCSHCHMSNLCDFHISIALLIGARSHILKLVALTHAQFLVIFRELLNTSHFWKRRMLSAHRWFHLRVEQRQNHSRLPSSRLTMQIMFRLVFSVIRLQVPFDESKALVHSWCSPDPSYDRDPSTNILLLCMLFRTSSSVTAVIARHSEPQ